MREIEEILRRWSEGNKPTEVEKQKLLAAELNDRARMKAFGIDKANIQAEIEERSQLFFTSSVSDWTTMPKFWFYCFRLYFLSSLDIVATFS